jgi:hypothetical protein
MTSALAMGREPEPIRSDCFRRTPMRTHQTSTCASLRTYMLKEASLESNEVLSKAYRGDTKLFICVLLSPRNFDVGKRLQSYKPLLDIL